MKNINNKYKRIITRVLAGEASASEKERLDAWLSRSEKHRQLYAQYKKIWELEPEMQVDAEFDTQHAWQNVLNMIESGQLSGSDETEKQPRIQSGRRFFINKTKNLYWISGVAAAFLILISTSLFFFISSPQADMQRLVADWDDELFILDDGSRVHLRAGSSLLFAMPFKDNKRSVKLSGSAFFEVAKDNLRPFVITTDHATIEILGTSFYVDEGDDHLIVYVSEGIVRLKSLRQNGPEAIISKGESGILHYDLQKIQKRKFDNMNFLAWKTGILEFNNEVLSEVFVVLEEVYAIRIKALDSVMNMKLSARFQDETPEDILNSISIVFGFDLSVKKDEYTIRLKKSDTL